MDKTEQKRLLAEKYLNAFLGFAIRRTGDSEQARELAQEIAFQCLKAISAGTPAQDFEAYVWGIARNTYKRYCAGKRPAFLEAPLDSFTHLAWDGPLAGEGLVREEEAGLVRLALSRLAGNYRKVIAGFYYDELPIPKIAEKLSLSEGMVKFYLRAGREKLKEAYIMGSIGEKSFNPSDFSIYKSAIDFSDVNVWEVFKRKLPCQIAILCHDGMKTVGELSEQTGVAAVYIEEEVGLLLEAGVMVSPAKGKYRTNFHIMTADSAERFKGLFKELHGAYVPAVREAFLKNLPAMREAGVFKFDAGENQWAWFFALHIANFDYCGRSLSQEDYPGILSCGSKGFIFAQESKASPWAAGATPTKLENCDVWPCDMRILGEYRRQRELRDPRKAQALYDIYLGEEKKEDIELYSELIAQGYAVKRDGGLFCNVPVMTKGAEELFGRINAAHAGRFTAQCGRIIGEAESLIESTIPPQLKKYAKGFAHTWISFLAGVYLREALHAAGFLKLPEEGDRTPLACRIREK